MEQRHIAHRAGSRQIAAFIDRSPSLVRVTRRAKTPDGAGGWRYGAEATVAPKVRCRFVSQESTAEQLQLITNTDGRRVEVAYSVIFVPDVAIQEGDVITRLDDGTKWYAGKVYDIPSWRRVAQVAKHVG